MKQYYVYVLRSIKDGKYYIGVTSLIPSVRLAKHMKGSVPSTKNRRPFILIGFLIFNNKEEAYKKEFYLKKPQGYLEKIELIKQWEALLH